MTICNINQISPQSQRHHDHNQNPIAYTKQSTTKSHWHSFAQWLVIFRITGTLLFAVSFSTLINNANAQSSTLELSTVIEDAIVTVSINYFNNL